MNASTPDLRLVQEPPEAPDPNIGQVLDDRYLVERILGKGGMGLVYAARHVTLQKPLAVKVLKAEVSQDQQVIARFRREAQAASAIGSPHICDVSDFGTLPDGSTYLVMEFLDGPSLSDVIRDNNPMERARVLDIVMQLCDALGAAHERGIVHRDLKPDNVHLVERGGTADFVKVLDFGIAKVGGAADKKLTQAGQVFGTPHYMSPEQCAGREVDHRTDIYALGVMLYEMVCGVVPFDADNLMGVLTKHVFEQPIPPRDFPPPVKVSPGLEATILKSLAKQAEQRYQTMAEFRADLELVLTGGTPDAVVHAIGGAAGTMRLPAAEAAGLMGAYPSIPDSVHDLDGADSKARGPLLLVLAVGAVLVLGAAAFGAAFYFGGRGDSVASSDEPPPAAATTPPEVASAQEPTEAQPTEAQPTRTGEASGPATEPDAPPAAQAPAPVMLQVTTDPAGVEVYGPDEALLGNTPFEVARPAAGAPPITITLHLAGYQDRDIPLSHLSSPQLNIRMVRTRASGRRSPRHTRPVITPAAPPQVRTLPPVTPTRPRRPQPSHDPEIVNPW